IAYSPQPIAYSLQPIAYSPQPTAHSHKSRWLMRIVLTAVLLFLLISGSSAQELFVHFISVGHGDAIFLEFPDGSTMLVDGGKPEDGGKVAGYIQDLGYANIDIILWTHIHPDHIGGLPNVINSLEAGDVWACPYYEDIPLYHNLQSAIESKGLTQKLVSRGDVFQFGEVEGRVLNPSLGSSLNQLRGPNGASVVIRLLFGETSLLLAADIDQDTDKELVRLYGDDLASTVLKCAHHGSGHSNSWEFLETVSPEIAVVTTGPNQYGYPSEKTIERIQSLSKKMFRTDFDGDIIIVLDGEKAMVESP
ncbi:MAG: MBL fold metallo-hydrolase, partial [candidate division Zixibacteria bacterium]|nr:MBL fold metallo-hydrolase [Candidatus Tariuqbacter arcticus]